MDAEGLKELVPLALERLYPGMWDEFLPGHAWELRRGDVPSLLSIHSGDGVGDYIRVHSGSAIDVPVTADLALFVARFNKDLWNGRAFVQTNPDRSLCFVALQDNFFGAAMSYEFQPSIDDFARRLGTLTLWAGRLGEQVRETYGGTSMNSAQAGVLM